MTDNNDILARKKFLFSPLIAVGFLILLEVALSVEFKLRGHAHRVKGFETDRTSSYNFIFDKRIGLVGPKKNVSVASHMGEFVDVFNILPYPNGEEINIGFPGSLEAKPKPQTVLAFGDSFTRGVGSVDAGRNSYAARISAEDNGFNVVIAGTGTTAKYQLDIYRKIGHRIKHNMVIQTTLTADFYENAYGIPRVEDVLAKLPADFDPNDFLHTYVYPLRYWQPELEYFADSKVPSYLVYNFFRFGKRLFKLTPSPKYDQYADLYRTISAELMVQSKYKRELEIKAMLDSLPGRLVNSCSPDDALCFSYYTQLYLPGKDEVKKKVVEYLASHIREFSSIARNNGARFALVIVPEKHFVYQDRYRKLFGDLDFQYPVRELKNMLQGEVDIYDSIDDFVASAKALDKPIYYRLDGHWNPDGYAIAAIHIERFLNQQLKGQRRVIP